MIIMVIIIIINIFQPARGGLTKGGEGHFFNEYDKKAPQASI